MTNAIPPSLPLATERFKDRLVEEGYNPAYGARPLRRAIMRLLEDSMAERMLAGDIKEGDSVILDGGWGWVWGPVGRAAGRAVGRGRTGSVWEGWPVLAAPPAATLLLTPLLFSAALMEEPPEKHLQHPAVTACCCYRMWAKVAALRWPLTAAVDADGQITVLNGDKKMTQAISSTPAGIS